jgi:hypothetical protein
MLKYFLILLSLVLLASTCSKKSPLSSPGTPTVKLSVNINDSFATIHMGDTLKITLLVPDSVTAISKIDGTLSKVFVNSLQSCTYGFTFYSVDTITKIGTRIRDAAHIFVTAGTIDPYLYTVFTSSGSKPFVSVLNFVPPLKGLYYFQTDTQENLMKINNSMNLGLRVNVNLIDKHWLINANYFNGPDQPDFITSMNSLNNEGYGFYCFKVN